MKAKMCRLVLTCMLVVSTGPQPPSQATTLASEGRQIISLGRDMVSYVISTLINSLAANQMLVEAEMPNVEILCLACLE